MSRWAANLESMIVYAGATNEKWRRGMARAAGIEIVESEPDDPEAS